ncbi:hypothetical protein F66182_8041 [Fusarium sp. NRRL 66182]|nr:hypothetical protein F66182_8041 [Fusarium sp. NRRL 66182]
MRLISVASLLNVILGASRCLAASGACWRTTTCNGPSSAAFPGNWNQNIFAPASRTVSPKDVLSLPSGDHLQSFSRSVSLNSGADGLVFDFGIEVGGIVSIDYQLVKGDKAVLGLAFTEAKNYIGRVSDNSNGGSAADGALLYNVTSAGLQTYTMPDAKLRGGFRYLTLFLSSDRPSTLEIKNMTLEIGFQPTWANLRAYQGYFDSSDDLINKIWYAGAYTLQTNAGAPKTGRARVSSSRPGWSNDATIGPGDTVLLDGAKRDRWVWIGDMGVAVPSAFLSTGDVESSKNALLAIYDNQKSDGTLPKAGPPYPATDSDTYHLWVLVGTFSYFLYSGDDTFLESIWPKYVKAMTKSLGQINDQGIMTVIGEQDWGRVTYGKDRAAASMLLYRSLKTGVDLAAWNPTLADAAALRGQWSKSATQLQEAVNAQLWDEERGAFKDSPDNSNLYPQDANSMSVAFGLVPPYSKQAARVSDYLQTMWTPIGPSCPELPRNISPFISSIEILSHFRAGSSDRAMKLIQDTWGWYLNNENGTQSTVPEGYLTDGSWGYRGREGYRNDPSYVSHAHGWSSGPTSALTEYAVGLRAVTPRGKAWQLRPASYEELPEAQAGFTTSLGKFSASYKVEGSRLVVSWNTPRNTKGLLILPGQENKSVTGGQGSTTITLP